MNLYVIFGKRRAIDSKMERGFDDQLKMEEFRILYEVRVLHGTFFEK